MTPSHSVPSKSGVDAVEEEAEGSVEEEVEGSREEEAEGSTEDRDWEEGTPPELPQAVKKISVATQ